MGQQASGQNYFTEHGQGRSECNLASSNKPLPLFAKKTALRELQNENRILVPNSVGSSFNNKVPTVDAVKVSGAKRPSAELLASPPCNQSSPSTAANNHLVYVRRKSDAEIGKSGICESTSGGAGCPEIMLNCQEELPELQSQIKEPKPSCFPALAPLPVDYPLSSSGKPSIPPIGISCVKSASTGPYHDSDTAGASALKRTKYLHWEERYYQWQQLLSNLEQSDPKDYLQMLRSLSSVELSCHAVELEKRSIQLSLEEETERERAKAPGNYSLITDLSYFCASNCLIDFPLRIIGSKRMIYPLSMCLCTEIRMCSGVSWHCISLRDINCYLWQPIKTMAACLRR
ncbi:uncharacterized protein LOC115735621 [Rhodamnia argentea]|uniref:Uncharacterized protein LOC115735621 n=1 Tax=Rhodamnia argentea TaxID=178133 RepID=A0ABM3GWQ4_9MYRT|nr:uncharacterized protein LOC115735621 [Rhodamnia argentea]